MPVVLTGLPAMVIGPPLQLGTEGHVTTLWEQVQDVQNHIKNLQQAMEVCFRDQQPSMVQQVMHIQQETVAAQSTLQQLLAQCNQAAIVGRTLSQAANPMPNINPMLPTVSSSIPLSDNIPSTAPNVLRTLDDTGFVNVPTSSSAIMSSAVMSAQQNRSSKVSKNGVGEHFESAKRSQTPLSADTPLVETAMAAISKQAMAPSPSGMFDENSLETPQAPQPEAVTRNIILPTPQPTPMSMPQMPTPQSEPKLVPANMPMARLFPGPPYEPTDSSHEDLTPFPEELQQTLQELEPAIDSKGGRPPSQTLKIDDDKLAELDKQRTLQFRQVWHTLCKLVCPLSALETS